MQLYKVVLLLLKKNPNKNIVLENQQKCLCHTKWPIPREYDVQRESGYY